MVAQAYDISREKQDHYAYISHSRAEKVVVVATPTLPVSPDENDATRTSSIIPSGPQSRKIRFGDYSD